MNVVMRQLPVDIGSDASDDAAGPIAFSDLLSAATGDRYAYCKDSIVFSPAPGTEVIACRSLLDTDVLSELIDRFSMQYPGADRRAVVSMWTLHYFSTLAIAIAVAGLELRLQVPASLDEMSLCIDPETGAPRAFLVPHLGTEAPAISVETLLRPVLQQHFEPLIEFMTKHAGVGRRMLWTNVAAYLDWMVNEIGKDGTHPAAEAAIAYTSEIWAGGWKKPTHGLIRRECDENGDEYGRRKVCCLRYGLPGVGGCGISCPLPEGRAKAR